MGLLHEVVTHQQLDLLRELSHVAAAADANRHLTVASIDEALASLRAAVASTADFDIEGSNASDTAATDSTADQSAASASICSDFSTNGTDATTGSSSPKAIYDISTPRQLRQ